jgi:ketosteroid isomerase-like protein
MGAFDFAGYQRAVERLDVEQWASFYADDAEWIEYREANPPRAPNVMRGDASIREFVQGIANAGIQLIIEREVVDDVRAAYMLTATLGDGRRVIENVILDHDGGRITRQIDVEAWD